MAIYKNNCLHVRSVVINTIRAALVMLSSGMCEVVGLLTEIVAESLSIINEAPCRPKYSETILFGLEELERIV